MAGLFYSWRLHSGKLVILFMKHTLRYLLILSAAASAGGVLADEEPRREVIIAQRHVLDWVPIAELTAQQRVELPPGSCGAYIAPMRDDPEATTFPDQAPLRALSNQTSIDDSNSAGSKVLLLGDVEVQQGYRQIKAQRAEFDDASGVLNAEGPIEIREPGILMLGDRAVVSRDDNILVIEEGAFVIHPANTRGSAGRITKNGIDSMVLEDASFTRCEPSNNAWALKGSKITLDFDARQGHASNVRLHVAGVPLLYFPYLRFPLGNERMSGFLWPSFEYGEDGSNVSIPYYFNLAPNYDLLWTLHSIEQHGLLNELNGRHLSRDFYTQLNGSYLENDRGIPSDNAQALINNGTITEAEAAPFKDTNRWLFNINQTGGAGQPWSSEIDFTRVSDVNFFRDFEFTDIAKADDNKVDQKIKLGYQWDHWSLSTQALQFQPLLETVAEPYQEMPKLEVDGQYDWDQWQLSLDHEWIHFAHRDATEAEPIITGNRARLDYDITWNYEREWGFFKPSVFYKSVGYQFDERAFVEGAQASQTISAPQLGLDTSLIFDRYTENYLQTFEPRLFFFRSPFRDHSSLFDLTSDGRDVDFDTAAKTFNFDQLFKNTRFSGGDRIEDANQLSLGLTTRFLSQQSSREWFSASAGQIFYFDDRQVTLTNTPETESRSDIAIKFSAKPTEHWQASSDLIYDEQIDAIASGNIGLTYTSPFNNLFDVNYRYIRGATSDKDTRQVDAAIIAPFVSHQWHLLWYGAYDITNARELDLITALEYDGCCYKARLGYRHWLDNSLVSTAVDVDSQYDWVTFFEVQFYGLGSSSERLDTFFEEKIDGYKEWKATHSKE